MRRAFLAAVMLAALLSVPCAAAWTWPAAGDVVQPFSFDPAHPYAAGQHRGVDVGGEAGSTVVAPEGGSVSFAGTVPSSGKSVTILTDGYAVTLTHLGTLLVTTGAVVAEGDPVGTIGPSGDPEVAQPYVHLGVRVAADEQGYLDPVGFLPQRLPPAPPAAVPSSAPPPVTEPDPTTGDVPAPPLAPVASAAPTAPAPAPAVVADPVRAAGPTEVSATAPVVSPRAVARPRVAAPVGTRAATPSRPRAVVHSAVVPRQAPSSTRMAPEHGSRVLRAAQAGGPSGTSESHPVRARVAAATRAPHPSALPSVSAARRPARARRTTVPQATVPAAADARRPLALAPSPQHRPDGRAVPGSRPGAGHLGPAEPVVATALLLTVLAFALIALRRADRRRPVRMIAASVREEEGPGRACVAVCGGSPSPWARRGVRRSVRRLRALPPPQGERRPHGQRDGRARHAGDGGRRSRGEVLR